MGIIGQQIRRVIGRSRFYADVPGLIQLLKFRERRNHYYRGLWHEAANNLGAEVTDWSFSFMRISKDGLCTFVRLGEVMLDDHLTLEIAGNKALVYRLMSEQGFRVPDHICVASVDIAEGIAFLDQQSEPVVVKPASGTGGGRGVTTGVTTRAQLHKAIRFAAAFDDKLIIERQMEGSSFRLLYLDGQFIDAVRRDAPIVIGDGRRSIRQLVAAENRRRLTDDPVTALSPLKIDRDCRNRLGEQGLGPGSRPRDGETIEIKRAINENDRTRNHNVRRDVHPETIEAGARLVKNLGISFAGLDVHCRDITRPLSPENGLISEVNTTPGIHHHYLIANQLDGMPVAEAVLNHLFGTGEGTITVSVPGPNGIDLHHSEAA